MEEDLSGPLSMLVSPLSMQKKHAACVGKTHRGGVGVAGDMSLVQQLPEDFRGGGLSSVQEALPVCH